MGGGMSTMLYGFETVKDLVCESERRDSKRILISTMETDKCVIAGTISITKEVEFVNKILSAKSQTQYTVVVYGRNCLDKSVVKKCRQLSALGFTVGCYPGGMFEWLLLKDVYGDDNFRTLGEVCDILEYKPFETVSS